MKPTKTSSSILCSAIAGLTAVLLSSQSFAADPDVAAIMKCKAMQDDAARLECYDSLNSETPAKPAPPENKPGAPAAAPAAAVPTVEKVPEAAAEAAAPEMNDDIGRENMGADTTDRMMVRGQVVSCSASRSGKLTFTFANGQVWRQKDNKKVRWRDCSFEVAIRKDFFGYIMKRDDDNKTVRIARVK